MGDSSLQKYLASLIAIVATRTGRRLTPWGTQVANHVETLVGLRHSQFLTALIVLAGVDQLSSLMHLVDCRIDRHHGQDDGDLDAGDFQFLHCRVAVALLKASVRVRDGCRLARVAGDVFHDGN